jgi:hypothetical protein
MRTIARGLSTVALLVTGVAGIHSAAAAPLSGSATAPDVEGVMQQVDYFYNGHNYCWYYDGWQGPGWYWCGYAWRRGYGWGSPVWGWNSWAWRGPRYYRGPGYRYYGRGPGGHYHR